MDAEDVVIVLQILILTIHIPLAAVAVIVTIPIAIPVTIDAVVLDAKFKKNPIYFIIIGIAVPSRVPFNP